MITYFGISGEDLSLITQIVAFAISFLLGLFGYGRKLAGVTLTIGLAANFLGQIVFAGGGPGAAAGMFILPLYCLICGYFGRGLWWLAVGRRKGKRVAEPDAEGRAAGSPSGQED